MARLFMLIILLINDSYKLSYLLSNINIINNNLTPCILTKQYPSLLGTFSREKTDNDYYLTPMSSVFKATIFEIFLLHVGESFFVGKGYVAGVNPRC